MSHDTPNVIPTQRHSTLTQHLRRERSLALKDVAQSSPSTFHTQSHPDRTLSRALQFGTLASRTRSVHSVWPHLHPSMPHYYITAHSDKRSRWTRIMHCPPIADNIFVFLTPATLINLSLASQTNTVAVRQFYKRAYNIHRHLSHFFRDPRGFRSLQARSGTLISGSNALQFLQRSTYKDSDLDLYTHPGYATEVAHWLTNHERYTFVPMKPSHGRTFDDVTPLEWSSGSEDPPIAVTDIDPSLHDYEGNGLHDVYHFERSDDDGYRRRVQIMSTQHSPMYCILAFHSSSKQIPSIPIIS